MSQEAPERPVQLTARHGETLTRMKAQHEANMAAHEEALTALKELIRRTAPRS